MLFGFLSATAGIVLFYTLYISVPELRISSVYKALSYANSFDFSLLIRIKHLYGSPFSLVVVIFFLSTNKKLINRNIFL